jgi:hypothetical protein
LDDKHGTDEERTMQTTQQPHDERVSLLGRLARNRAITGIFLVCIVLGAALGAFQLPEDLSVARRILGGGVGGAGVALLMTASRMFG